MQDATRSVTVTLLEPFVIAQHAHGSWTVSGSEQQPAEPADQPHELEPGG